MRDYPRKNKAPRSESKSNLSDTEGWVASTQRLHHTSEAHPPPPPQSHPSHSSHSTSGSDPIKESPRVTEDPTFSPAVTPSGETLRVLSPTTPSGGQLVPPVLPREKTKPTESELLSGELDSITLLYYFSSYTIVDMYMHKNFPFIYRYVLCAAVSIITA